MIGKRYKKYVFTPENQSAAVAQVNFIMFHNRHIKPEF